MRNTDYVLEALGLVKRFRDTTAVDGVDLVVRSGERVALLGPNGAGKTTTLFMLLGVIQPDAGSVRIAGCDLPRQRSEAMMQVGFSAGYMPLAERLRVREFLTMYGRLYGMADPTEAIEKGLAKFRIDHLIDSMSVELSSGQRTLVGIVKATLHNPRLLVLDEPTASLDPDVARRVRNALEDFCTEHHISLLITSHNMVEIERLCERVVFLSQGKVVADDTPAAVAQQYGRVDLEGVFLHLAEERDALLGVQETDRP
jgi:ABC-2 type transport system ATP-binding protein